MATFFENDPTLQNYWRAIILYGQNVASYKFALAKALIDLKKNPNDLIKLDDINESVGFDFLQEGKYIVTDQLEDLNGNITAEVGDIVYTTENQKPFDNYFGVNLYHVINEDTKQKVMVSEDNIERIRL